MQARDLLFELGTEELPPRALPALSQALTAALLKGLDDAGLRHGRAQSFATPRRLALRVMACAEVAPDRPMERRGPPASQGVDAAGQPTPAALAFARSCGVEVSALERLTTDRGAWLAYRGIERGLALRELIGGIVERAVAALPIPKRMRWGAGDAEFVRPVHTVVLLYGEEVLPITVLGIPAGRLTSGHRFHHPKPVTLKSAASYEGRLKRAKVIADFGKRRELVRAGVTAAALGVGGEALIGEELLDEVTALVEWPVAIAGRFERRFLDLPREVVIATVQDHQRYFAVQDALGKLTGDFVTVANLESRDPAKVREGNERVVRPRLADAVFFWEQDLKTPLDAQAAKLATVTYQTQLGSYADKTRRVVAVAGLIGARLGAGSEVERAAALAKADLVTAMVGEFPELQGTIGRYYAAAQGESSEVARALEEHYRPRHAGDGLPTSVVGRTVALADKLDTLAGIFAIGQRPTGAKDPFALRRAALGVLRILLEGELDLDLSELLQSAAAAQPVARAGVTEELYDFIAERLRGVLLERNSGTTVEMLDAVLAKRPRSPFDAEKRLRALARFLGMTDATVLAAINKRIANILRKTQLGAATQVQPAALDAAAERRLYAAIEELRGEVHSAVRSCEYLRGLELLAGLRAAVDGFFDEVMVMDENPQVRANRLALLRDAQELLGAVADLSRLPG